MPRQKSTHVDEPRAVGRRLRSARERVGLSQRELSFPGCSPAYISRIEAGDRIPSLQLLRELGRRLGVSEDYLATGAEGSVPSSSTLLDAEVALRLDDVEQASRLYEETLAEAADGPTRARALEGLGQVALRQDRAREAIDLFQSSLAITGGDPSERPHLAESLARAYASLEELAPAIALLERCVERYEREGDPVRFVRFACLLGYALTDAGDFGGAERIVAKALATGRDIADPYSRARLYWSQSRLLGAQGRSESAAQYARFALHTLQATEDTYALAHAHQLLASLYLDASRADEAIQVLDEGWPLIVGTASPSELAHYRIEQARALAAIGKSEEAAALAMEATGQLGESQDFHAGRAYTLLGDVFNGLGDTARALELYELGIEVLERQGPNRYLVGAYRRLAELLEADGRTDEALDVLKRAIGVQERAGRLLA